jgi:hypothetical protein
VLVITRLLSRACFSPGESGGVAIWGTGDDRLGRTCCSQEGCKGTNKEHGSTYHAHDGVVAGQHMSPAHHGCQRQEFHGQSWLRQHSPQFKMGRKVGSQLLPCTKHVPFKFASHNSGSDKLNTTFPFDDPTSSRIRHSVPRSPASPVAQMPKPDPASRQHGSSFRRTPRH